MSTIAVPDVESLALYTLSDAARILDVPTATFANWAKGYDFKTLAGRRHAPALVTTAARGRGRTVPFIGLAEAYVLAAFRSAGVPMQRIRPAVERLTREIDLDVALASERLVTDGAEVLYDFGQSGDEGADAVAGLVVVRNQQRVFNDVVSDYLQTITFDGGLVARFGLPKYGSAGVSVDPQINSGQPTITRRGVRVADVLSRVKAGESISDVAFDYDLSSETVRAVIAAA
ncbi:DUF433 domain-containing protein [Rhodococcoides kyotonense]|uniref:Uncharacterized conserved protein, DUF433 family n=1 Tax=Rhodococcoides kyotonense TaxID=398843 RepID=A0A239M8J4_9NOCA|nr:DUF433 domain-containing protein [Rhodococcus kyotonensis]SNT38492.1 Uncharacterized conserved protein, DUF433 family [Rhodococcus kyotonensis]